MRNEIMVKIFLKIDVLFFPFQLDKNLQVKILIKSTVNNLK